MKALLIAAPLLAALLAAVLTVVIGGLLMPRAHRATASVRLSRPVDTVWPLISDPALAASFRPEVKGIEVLPDRDGHRVYRELGAAMGEPLTLEVSEESPPHRRVTRIADDTLPFGGTWTYELTPEGTGSRLRITEDGDVKTPAFRYIGRLIGQDATIKGYLKCLAKHLGDAPVVEG